MSCPIPSDFQDLIIDQNASVCEALGKLGPATQLWYDAYSCIYKNNLDFTEEFRNKICATGCGGGGGGSTSTSTTQAGSGQQDYSAAGSYEFEVPAGITSLTVIVVGGGGGGGGRGSAFLPPTRVCSGGGSGEKRIHTFTVVPLEIVNITVGSGGTQDAVTGDGSSGTASGVFYDTVSVVANPGGGGQNENCTAAPFAGGAGGSGGSGGTGTNGNAGGPSTAACASGSGGASVGLSAGAGSAGSIADNSHPGSPGAVRITW